MPLGDIVLLNDRPGREPTRLELLLRAFRSDRGGTLDHIARTELRAEIVRGLFVQAPGLLVVEIAVVLFIAAVFWGNITTGLLVPWAALVVAAALVRWVHCRRYFERCRQPEEARAWGRTFALGTLLSGALWGIGGVVLFSPNSGVLMIVQVFLVTGLSASALTGYTAFLPAFYAFVLPAVTPFGVCLMLNGAPPHVFTACLLAVWISIFVYLAHALNAHTLDRVMLLLGHGRMAETLRKARDAADEASRAKTRFLANMSHELRTPLNAIIGFSEIMRREMFGALGNAKYQQYAGDINRSGQHLLQLINDILDVAKIEAGGQQLSEALIDLPTTLKQCGQIVEVQARASGVSFAVETPPRLPPLRADPTRFHQIMLNLISNAVKFTRAGGSVTVSANVEPNGGLLVQVRDTGVGMRPEDIPRALQPFVQLDHDAPRGDPGTGLGLALVKTLVEAHSGTIEITSAPGKGTTVSVRFPKDRVVPILAEVSAEPRKVA